MTQPADPGGKPTILAVDDTKDNLMQIYRLLSDDYQIRIALSGENALEVVATPPLPQLILLDVVMPGIDGYEVCRISYETHALVQKAVSTEERPAAQVEGFSRSITTYAAVTV